MINCQLFMNPIQYYIDQYQKARPWDLPAFAFEVKDKAMEKLSGTSIPLAKKDEEYLYTPIASFLEQQLPSYRPSAGDFTLSLITDLLNSDIPTIDSYSIVITNGYYLSNEPIHKLPEGVIVGSFVSMIKQFDDIYHHFFTNYELSDDILVNLNAMLCGDGFFLYVPAGVKPSKPIQIINVFDRKPQTLIQPRNLIMMEPGSSAEVLVCDYTLSDGSYLCNDVTEVVLNKSAMLDLVRLQKVNDATRIMTHTFVKQQASSKMRTHYISLGGNSVRNSLTVTLAEKKAEHIVEGLTLTKQTGHTDHQILIRHASPDCHSNQLFKQILAGTSTGAFTGRIVVDKDAQKTLAYQRSSNILLHPKAKMNIRPQLEIYADDVKCSHGATVGQLDADALFYLRSRGISEAEAKKMLLQAFAGEVIDHICEPFRKSVTQLVEQEMEEIFKE